MAHSHSHFLPNGYQTHPTHPTSPRYLNLLNRCRTCQRLDHIAERCPHEQRWPQTSQTRSNSAGSGYTPRTQPRTSYELSVNRPYLEPHITPPSQYLKVRQTHRISKYTNCSPESFQSPSMAPDLDFPSLAGTSLASSLLNSPLNINPSVTFMPYFPVQQPPIQGNAAISSGHSAAPPQQTESEEATTTAASTSPENPTFGEEMSFFDQAIWNNDCYYLSPNSGTSPIDFSWR